MSGFRHSSENKRDYTGMSAIVLVTYTDWIPTNVLFQAQTLEFRRFGLNCGNYLHDQDKKEEANGLI